MFCDRCGANLQGPVTFCPHCGRQFSAAPLQAPAVNRLAAHARSLAIVWLVYSALRVLPGIFLRSFSNWALPFDGIGPVFVGGVLHAVSGFLIIGGIVGLIAGWGLYERRHWARMLAIVLAFLNLLHFPLGTAVAIYTLWVLMPAESEAEWRRTAV